VLACLGATERTITGKGSKPLAPSRHPPHSTHLPLAQAHHSYRFGGVVIGDTAAGVGSLYHDRKVYHREICESPTWFAIDLLQGGSWSLGVVRPMDIISGHLRVLLDLPQRESW
jgi:hypothetical protein